MPTSTTTKIENMNAVYEFELVLIEITNNSGLIEKHRKELNRYRVKDYDNIEAKMRSGMTEILPLLH